MRIYNNVPALATYNFIKINSAAIEKSISRLSSGLRINSAADDAAGLAISEKMRAQVRGLDQAARNAQDGISMLQTAEGALGEVQSILQRMRELSVQSANDTLTSQDRQYIQLEVEQLKDEIDRIANTTQFNKKKLLNGNADILWSSDRLSTKAIVKGSIDGKAANYKISVDVIDTGQAQVQKSNIFEAYIEPGVVNGRVVGMAYSQAKIEMTKTENVLNINPTAQSLVGTGSCGHTALYADPVGNMRAGNYTYDFPDRDPVPANNNLPVIRPISAFGMNINDIFIDNSNPWALFATEPPNTNITFEAVAIHAQEEAVTFRVISRRFDVNGNTLPDIESYVTISEKGVSGGILGSGVVQTHPGPSYSVGVFDALGIDIAPDKLKLNKDFSLFNIGDSFHLNITPPLRNAGRTSLRITGPGGDRLYYVLDSSLNNAQVDIPYLSINTATGDVYNALMKSAFSALPYPHPGLNRNFVIQNNGTNATQNVNIDVTMEIVYKFERQYRTLGEIYKNVHFPQSLTILQGSSQASVTLYAEDTFYDFAKKLNDAIAFGLMNGKYVGNSASNFAAVADGTANTSESVGNLIPKGFLLSMEATMLIRSAVPGSAGEIYFSGDDDLLRAMGLSTIQESRETTFSVSVQDAHSGQPIANNVKISGNMAVGVIDQNLDFTFDPLADMTVFWNNMSKRFDMTANSSSYETILHIADNSTTLQIGANEREELRLSFGDIGSLAIGVRNVALHSRELAARAISRVDSALSKVSDIRSRLGAYQNRLEYTINNLSTASENLTASESRIRDLDMAKEMVNFTKLNVLLQSGNSMLTQANQLPQMVLSLLRQ